MKGQNRGKKSLKINSEYLLITAFCVDKDNQLYYKKKEMNQIK